MSVDDEVVESFESLFIAAFDAHDDQLERRMRAERRTALTDKQRKRGPGRTAQLNFRCTPALKRKVAGLVKHCNFSIAELMEEAIEMYAAQRNYGGGE